MLQEKMSTMEAEIAEKDRQLTALREENSSLAGRNAVLEKVLALREEQLKQQAGGAADTSQVPLFILPRSATLHRVAAVGALRCCPGSALCCNAHGAGLSVLSVDVMEPR
jgi:hypothetical protein